MIKMANFSKFCPDSGQMMLKLGRNMAWVEILCNFKTFDDVISNSKV